MAQAKKKKTSPKPKAKVTPFKTRKSREPVAQGMEAIEPDEEIRTAIDQFREFQEQARHFEGEATIFKDKILDYSIGTYAQRAMSGKTKSFKLVGRESIVNYIIQDSGAGLSEDDLEEFSERWGEEAAEQLITKDFASIRFDAKVLEANYDRVVEALESLPDEVLENLFKPMFMKARPGAVERAKKFADSAEELTEIIKSLKLKNYIK